MLRSVTAMIEALIYLVILGAVAWHPGLRQLAREIPLGYRAASLALIVLLVVGQLAKNGGTLFPFIEWQMYTRSAPDDPIVFEYTAVTEAGDEREVRMLRLADAMGIRWSILECFEFFSRATNPVEQQVRARTCQKRLRMLIGVYNRRHGGEDAIQLLRVWRLQIPLRDYPGLEAIPRELLWEIAAPAGPSDSLDG